MATSYSPKIVTDGLVVLLDAGNSKSYPGTGNSWVNVADTTMTGSIIGATYSSNNLGNFNFNEVSDYVLISSGSKGLNIGTNHTWVWWLKVPELTGTLFQYIYSHNNFGVANACNIWLIETSISAGENPPHVLKFQYNDTGTNDVGGRFNNELSSSLFDNQWHMMTLVKSGWSYTDNTLYVDNKKFTSLFNDAGAASITKCNPTGNLNLARRVDADANRYFGGNIATFMMYKDKALSEQEVLQIYNATRGRFGV